MPPAASDGTISTIRSTGRSRWSRSIVSLTRSASPYKGAFALIDGDVVHITDAEVVRDVAIENRHVGKVLFQNEGSPVVICGRGLLHINEAVVESDAGARPFLPLKKLRTRFC
jgi:methionyl-tRNA formyltransferase